MKKNFSCHLSKKMEDFELLEQMINNTSSEEALICLHEERKVDKGVYVCLKCGFSEKVNDGQTYTSHKMYKRSSKNTNISVNLEQKGFDRDIIVIANRIYSEIVDENTKRTGNRSSIICACIFQAFKLIGSPVDYSYVYTKYNIKKKSALKGLKIVNTEIAKKKSFEFYGVISSPIAPESFIISYMNELKASKESIEEVLSVYDLVKADREIGMSRPQSIAAGVIFYWLKKKGMSDAMKIVEEKANLSQITIAKKAKFILNKMEPTVEDEDSSNQ